MTSSHAALGCTRRRWLQRTSAWAGACAAATRAQAQAQAGNGAIKVGLTPFLPTRQLMGTYEPLRQHLAAQLQRPVEFYSAPSFERLLDNARARDQAFTMMPVHLALLCIEDEGFSLVARSGIESLLALWLPPESALPWPAQAPAAAVLQSLRGRRVGVSDALSLAALATARWRDDQGLADAVELRPHASLAGAVLAAQRREVDFVAAPEAALRDSLAPGAPEFRAVLSLTRLPAPAFVAAPWVAAAEAAAFRAALLSHSAAGTSFATAQYLAATPADLAAWRPYVARARVLLAQRAAGRPAPGR